MLRYAAKNAKSSKQVLQSIRGDANAVVSVPGLRGGFGKPLPLSFGLWSASGKNSKTVLPFIRTGSAPRSRGRRFSKALMKFGLFTGTLGYAYKCYIEAVPGPPYEMMETPRHFVLDLVYFLGLFLDGLLSFLVELICVLKELRDDLIIE